MAGGAVFAGLLVGVAVLAAAGPRRRSDTAGARRSPEAGGHAWRRRSAPGRDGSRADPDTGAADRGSRVIRLGRRNRDDGDARLAAVLVEVASLVQAGVSPADAWSRVLRLPVSDRVPTVPQLATARLGTRRERGGAAPPLEAVVAAARVAEELGAPLAGVLHQVAAAITAQADVAADVAAALAGPRASARVLAWLPPLGVVLGMAMGADPLGALLGGGIGTAAGALGVVLMVVGRWWTGALLRGVARGGASS